MNRSGAKGIFPIIPLLFSWSEAPNPWRSFFVGSAPSSVLLYFLHRLRSWRSPPCSAFAGCRVCNTFLNSNSS